MGLRADLQASLAHEARRQRYLDEAAALVSLARSQSRWAVRYAKQGLLAESKKYRADSWWHFGKAHEKRQLANHRSHLREVA